MEPPTPQARRFLDADLAACQSACCACPSALTLRMGFSANVVTCLRCQNIFTYRTHTSEPNKGDVIVHHEVFATAPDVLRWLGSFPRQLSADEFLPASARVDSEDELEAHVVGDSTMRTIDRFCEAGLPGPPPSGLPEEFGGFESIRLVCLEKDRATFRQWVEWSLFHPASHLAFDVVRRRPDPVADLVDLLRKDSRAQHATTLLQKLGKGHAQAMEWLHEEVDKLTNVHGEALASPLCTLADTAEYFDAFDLAPQLRMLAARLDDSNPSYIKKRIERIINTLAAGKNPDGP